MFCYRIHNIHNYIKKISKYLLSEFKNIFGKNEIFLGIFCFVVFPILNLKYYYLLRYISYMFSCIFNNGLGFQN